MLASRRRWRRLPARTCRRSQSSQSGRCSESWTRCWNAAANPVGHAHIAVIGGGTGGVELILSVRSRLIADAQTHGWDATNLSFALVTDGEILQAHHPRVRSAFRRILTERKVAMHEHRRAREVTAGAISFDRGPPLAGDAVLIATDATAPAWFAGTGLARDAGGLLAVGPTLQFTNDADVFAAGDCAALIETPRAKAGVFAVQAGPLLAANLRRRRAASACESGIRNARSWR
jgi:selenide, water dikinase